MSDSKAGAASVRRPKTAGARSAATSYDKDVILWSQEQARFLRAGRFAELDVEHLADEIEDVGKSEKRELASRTAVLLAHLLKWRSQPENRSKSSRYTIRDQRRRVALAIKETPSPKAVMHDRDWQENVWLTPAPKRERRPGLRPRTCPRRAPGRWSRRPIRISGRSDELLRPEPLIHRLGETPWAMRRKIVLVKLRLNRGLQTRRSVSLLHHTI